MGLRLSCVAHMSPCSDTSSHVEQDVLWNRIVVQDVLVHSNIPTYVLRRGRDHVAFGVGVVTSRVDPDNVRYIVSAGSDLSLFVPSTGRR